MKKYLMRALKRISFHIRDESGISLVESLVAVAILGVSVTSLIGSLSVGSSSVNIQSEATIAQNLAQTQLETIKSAAYDATGYSYSAVSAPSGYAVSISTNSSIYANNKIEKITVTITHNGSAVLTVEDYKVNR
jgi:type II secretory pathway pseudopilin PulG